ncbi:unnamed protein product, partial [Closterium sp. Naga37s-1]
MKGTKKTEVAVETVGASAKSRLLARPSLVIPYPAGEPLHSPALAIDIRGGGSSSGALGGDGDKAASVRTALYPSARSEGGGGERSVRDVLIVEGGRPPADAGRARGGVFRKKQRRGKGKRSVFVYELVRAPAGGGGGDYGGRGLPRARTAGAAESGSAGLWGTDGAEGVAEGAMGKAQGWQQRSLDRSDTQSDIADVDEWRREMEKYLTEKLRRESGPKEMGRKERKSSGSEEQRALQRQGRDKGLVIDLGVDGEELGVVRRDEDWFEEAEGVLLVDEGRVVPWESDGGERGRNGEWGRSRSCVEASVRQASRTAVARAAADAQAGRRGDGSDGSGSDGSTGRGSDQQQQAQGGWAARAAAHLQHPQQHPQHPPAAGGVPASEHHCVSAGAGASWNTPTAAGAAAVPEGRETAAQGGARARARHAAATSAAAGKSQHVSAWWQFGGADKSADKSDSSGQAGRRKSTGGGVSSGVHGGRSRPLGPPPTPQSPDHDACMESRTSHLISPPALPSHASAASSSRLLPSPRPPALPAPPAVPRPEEAAIRCGFACCGGGESTAAERGGLPPALQQLSSPADVAAQEEEASLRELEQQLERERRRREEEEEEDLLAEAGERGSEGGESEGGRVGGGGDVGLVPIATSHATSRTDTRQERGMRAGQQAMTPAVRGGGRRSEGVQQRGKQAGRAGVAARQDTAEPALGATEGVGPAQRGETCSSAQQTLEKGGRGAPAREAVPPAQKRGCPGAERGLAPVAREGVRPRGCPGAERGCPGAERGCPGAERGCPSAERGCPGAERGCPGAGGGVPLLIRRHA